MIETLTQPAHQEMIEQANKDQRRMNWLEDRILLGQAHWFQRDEFARLKEEQHARLMVDPDVRWNNSTSQNGQ